MTPPLFPVGFRVDLFLVDAFVVGVALAELVRPANGHALRTLWGVNAALGLGVMMRLVTMGATP